MVLINAAINAAGKVINWLSQIKKSTIVTANPEYIPTFTPFTKLTNRSNTIGIKERTEKKTSILYFDIKNKTGFTF
ncbi:hypothetical protein GCM10023315_22090 [Algibacter aquimarinus]|uniref:Uncharacterized protein n=1 Tax=Algibacter aquimarinus TaxID=1136748 RepID=A0ABP9HI90_9FLAO